MIPPRLAEVLATHAEKLQTYSYDIDKLQGDASSRTYFRVTTQDRNYVAMVLPENQPSSVAEEITKVEGAVTELPFVSVQTLLRPVLRVPDIHVYDAARGVLILEDFGDRLLLNELEKSDENNQEALYRKALDALHKLSCLKQTEPRTCVAFRRRYDKELYQWEFVHFVEYALDKQLDPGVWTEALRTKALGLFENLSKRFASWNPVLCHRDFHSRNLMVLDGAHDIGVIDFQDALEAPLFYDLASLLRDSYFTIAPLLQDRLLEYYHQGAKDLKLPMSDISKDEFRYAFDLMGLQRNMKAAGRFFYIDEVKGNPAYLRYVPRTVSYIQASLDTHPELKPLRTILAPFLGRVIEAGHD